MKKISKKITCMLLSPILAAVMILGTLSMFTTGCGSDDSKSTPRQGEQDFIIDIAGTSYSVEVKHPASLDAATINDFKDKFQQALDDLNIPGMVGSNKLRFENVLDRGLVIVVEEGVSYNGYQIKDYCTMAFHADYLSANTYITIAGRIYAAIRNDLYPMGTVPDVFYADWAYGIKFYKGDVTDEQVDDMMEEFDNNLSGGLQVKLANHIKEIHVTGKSGQISHEGDVLSVGYDADITDIIIYIYNEGFLTKNQQRDGIMVVKINGTVDAVMSAKPESYMQPYQMMNEKQA